MLAEQSQSSARAAHINPLRASIPQQDGDQRLPDPSAQPRSSYHFLTSPDNGTTPTRATSTVSATRSNPPRGILGVDAPGFSIQTGQPPSKPTFWVPPPPVLSGVSFPPPPPPPWTERSAPASVPIPQRHAFIGSVERKKEELRDSRDVALGSRFRLRDKRRDLRDLRIQAGSKDGSVFNLLRQYLYDKDADLPQHIQQALDAASSLRDQLGMLETDYEDAEENYNTLEWRYTRKESNFVDELVNSDLVPISNSGHKYQSPAPGHVASMPGEFARLWTGTMTMQGNDPYSIVQDPMDLPDYHVVMSGHPSAPRPQVNILESAPIRTQSADQPDKKADWALKMEHINEWLLGMISSSPLQKAQLKAIDGRPGLDKELWWTEVEHHWDLDYGNMPEFHTGDSTVFQEDFDQQFQASTDHFSGSRGSVVKVDSSNPLLPVDHLLDTAEHTNRPPSIGSTDLPQVSSRYENAFMPQQLATVRTDISASTGPMASRRTSTSSAGAPATETSSCNSDRCTYCSRSARLPDIRSERYTDCLDIRQVSDQGTYSTPATPTQQLQDLEFSLTPRLPTTIGGSAARDATQIATAKIIDLIGPPQISLDTITATTTTPRSNCGTESQGLHPTQIQLPPSSELESSPNLEAQPVTQSYESRCPFAPLFQPVGSSNWSQFPFPILPLISSNMRPCAHSGHQFPFVSCTISLVQLPGPPSDELYL